MVNAAATIAAAETSPLRADRGQKFSNFVS
jgi:hypothetical protein